MNQLIDAVQQLQKEIGALRSDVQSLSQKVDNISISGTVPQKTQTPAQAHALKATTVRSDRAMAQENRVTTQTPPPAPQAPPVAPVRLTRTREKTAIEKFFEWFARDWPMKVGGFFVIAAAGWFVVYATKENLISEAGRVTLGYLFAVAAIVFGALRASAERVQGNLFLVIGIAVMLIATLAGINYMIILPVLGLGVMLVSVGLVTLVSLKQKSVSLTGSMIFFGATIPLFLFDDIGINVIFAYLFILTIGTLWVVYYTGWRSLTMMMLCVTGFYSIGYIFDSYGPTIETVQNVAIAFLFTGVFYIANVSAILRTQKTYFYDLAVAVGTGILFLIWMLNFAPASVEVFLLLIGTLLFACASYIIFVRTAHKEPTMLYAGVSAMLLTVATARLFDGPVLVSAYLVEAAFASMSLLYLNKTRMNTTTRAVSVVIYSIPAVLSLGSIVQLFDFLSKPYGSFVPRGIHIEVLADMMPHLFVVFVLCVTAFSVAIAVLRLTTDHDEKENMVLFRFFACAGGISILLLIWFVTHLFVGSYDVATFMSLVIYTVCGVVFYVFGAREGYAPYKVVGGILFGIVVARVLFVEFWEMSIAMRTLTSFVLGALLISTAFIRPHKK